MEARDTERRPVPSAKSSAHTNAATKPLPGKGVLQPWPRREGVERRAGQQQIRDTSISQGGGMASAADGNGNSTTYKHSSQVRPMLHPCTDAPLTARRTNDDVDVEHATWIREYRRMPVQSGHVGLWPLGLIIVGVPSVLLGDPLDGRHCRRAPLLLLACVSDPCCASRRPPCLPLTARCSSATTSDAYATAIHNRPPALGFSASIRDDYSEIHTLGT